MAPGTGRPFRAIRTEVCYRTPAGGRDRRPRRAHAITTRLTGTEQYVCDCRSLSLKPNRRRASTGPGGHRPLGPPMGPGRGLRPVVADPQRAGHQCRGPCRHAYRRNRVSRPPGGPTCGRRPQVPSDPSRPTGCRRVGSSPGAEPVGVWSSPIVWPTSGESIIGRRERSSGRHWPVPHPDGSTRTVWPGFAAA